jgi:protocatechuate 3,4-dioxygenase beta subunit
MKCSSCSESIEEGVVAILLCAILCGAGTADTETSGCVLTPDGKPVKGAEITIYRTESYVEDLTRLANARERPVIARTHSDEAGLYRIEHDLKPLEEMVVIAEGFAPFKTDECGAGGVVLLPAPMISARVTRAGSPVAGATVIWFAKLDQGNWVSVTDDAGRYSVPDPSVWASLATVLSSKVVVDYHFPGFNDVEFAVDIEVEPLVKVSGSVVDGEGKGVEDAEIRWFGRPVGKTGADGSFEVQLRSRQEVPIEVLHSGGVATALPSSLPGTITLAPGQALQGRVVNQDGGGIPLAGVSISNWKKGFLRQVVAQVDGRFTVARLPAGDLWVSAEAPGFTFGQEVEIDLTQPLTRAIELVGTSKVVIEGVVKDSENHPVAGAVVYALEDSLPFVLGLPWQRFKLHAYTNCNGRFALSLPPSTQRRRLIAVRPGLSLGVSAWLEPTPSRRETTVVVSTDLHLNGQVLNEDGEPVGGVGVAAVTAGRLNDVVSTASYRPPRSRVHYLYRTAPDGTFELPLIAGQYDLIFERSGYLLESVVNVSVKKDGVPVLATLHRPVTLAGRVLRSDGEPIARTELSAIGENSDKRNTRTDEDGRFRVTNLRKGPYEVKAVDLESKAEASVGAVAPGPELVIVLPETFTVTGRVVDQVTGKPIPGAEVHPLAADRLDMQDLQVTTDDDGRFEVKGLEAGRYHLVVKAKGYVKEETREVNVGCGFAPEDLEIALDPGLQLAGQVVDESGNLVPGATVEAIGLDHRGWREDEHNVLAEGLSDPSGLFSLRGLEPSEILLKAKKEGMAPDSQVVKIDGDRDDLVLTLGQGLELSGQVQDPDGSPVHQAWVSAGVEENEDEGPIEWWMRDGPIVFSEADGSFRFTDLKRGYHWVQAGAPGFEIPEPVRVDPERKPHLTITLMPTPKGSVRGEITGIDNPSSVQVEVRGAQRGKRKSTADGAGRYRIDGVIAGNVTVTAKSSAQGRPRSLLRYAEVPAEGEVRVDFDFREGSSVMGLVTLRGKPVAAATVLIVSDHDGSFQTRTDTDGFYQGFAPDGRYILYARSVDGRGRSRLFEVDGPTVLDIDLAGPTIFGRVSDGATGEPVSGALASAAGLSPVPYLTDQAGAFIIEDLLDSGRVVLRVDHPEYALWQQELDLPKSSRLDVEVILVRTDSITVRLVNELTGEPVWGWAVAQTLDGSSFVRSGEQAGDGHSIHLRLLPGLYKISASAEALATRTVVATSPGDDVLIGLTPGGTLRIRSAETARRQARLIMPTGEEYVRCWCNEIAELWLECKLTVVANIAPGDYNLVVTETDGQTNSYPVTIIEGQETEVTIR